MRAIAAVDENWAIGWEGQLLCRLSADLRRFKARTMGHAVILGRNTLAGFPGGKPLPGRENLILSTTMEEAPLGARVFRSVGELLAYAPEDAYVIGGGQVYRALLPHCDEVDITKIHAAFPADTWFPNLDACPDWEAADTQGPLEENGLTFSYLTYRRRWTP